MSVKAWYKYLLEVNVTHSGKPGPGSRELVSCQVKRLNCLVDWNKSWMAAASQVYHPQWAYFYGKCFTTLSQPGIPSTVCTPCEEDAEDNSEHGLLTWSYIRVGAENLLLALLHEDPNMTLERTRLKSKVFSLESDPKRFWSKNLLFWKNFGPTFFFVKIRSVTSKILLKWTYIAWTNVTLTVGIC